MTCGSKKRKRFGREAEDGESLDGDLSTTPQPELDSDLSVRMELLNFYKISKISKFSIIFQTTESVYMPLETTASMIDEIEAEIWSSEKEKFDTKTKLTIKFGPFEWVNIETTPQPEIDIETTPVFDMEVIDYEVQTQGMNLIDLFRPYRDPIVNKYSETEVELEEMAEDIETIEEVLEEIETEVEEIDEEILEDEESGVPGAVPLLVIAGSALVAFLSGFLLVVKYKCRNNQPKLLN